MRQLHKFCLVGSIGFVIDSLCFAGLMMLSDNLALARIVAFWLALTATWVGNRTFTFKQSGLANAFPQWFKHMLSAHIGGGVNMLCFWLGLYFVPLQVAFCCGILAGLLSNYFLSTQFVFKHA